MIKYKVVDYISELPDFDPELPIFCDIESDGLYINTRLVQYFQPQTSEYVFILDVGYFGEHTSKTTAAMYKRLGRKPKSTVEWEDLRDYHSKLWLVWWNGSYDQGTLKFGSKKVDDLWYLSKMQFNLLDSFTLDSVTNYLFPHKNYYEGLDKSLLQKKGFKPGKLSEDQLLYSATDVYVMAEIWPIVQRTRSLWSYRIDRVNLEYCVRWQQTGLKVHREERTRKEAEYEELSEELEARLPSGLNVNSYIQVRKVIGHDESNEAALLKLIASGCPYSRDILDQRSVLKSINFLQTYDRDRVYGFFNPYGARTGRWTCKGGDRPDAVNMQQLPRKLRDVFAYTEESGRMFVGGDLPTAELRLAAAIYVDEEMVKAFKEEIDIHILTASKDANVRMEDVTSDMRKKAKASNFGLLYGMKEDGFISYAFQKYGIVYSSDEATVRRNSWLNTYSGIRDKIKEITHKFYHTPEFTVRTPGGRTVKPGLYTDAMNIPIQGAVAEVTKLWIHYIHQMHGGDVPIANSKHDDVTLDIPVEEESYWKELMDEAGKKTWSEYCKLSDIIIKDIPMKIEITSGRNYNDAC